MKQLKVLIWCDACYDENEAMIEAATTTPPMSMDPRKDPKSVDLCEMHEKSLVTPLAELLASRGVTPGTEPRLELPKASTRGRDGASFVGERWICPLCKEELARSAAIGHVWARHHNEERPAAPLTCPDCPYPGEGKKGTAQGVATHRARAHGYDSLTDALAGAVA